jgi:MoaA/NifB/PqqE/SkfB family radical SAM enzyme
MKRPMGMMSDEIFHSIIKQGMAMDVHYYAPFLNGEPFLFPRIWEWLDYMQKEKVRVILYTNAVFMDVDRLVKYKNIHQVNCSMNAFTKKTYKKVMPYSNYDKAKKNIDDLIRKAKFDIKVSMVVVKENRHEMRQFERLWREHRNICYANTWPGWSKNKSFLAKKGKRKIPCHNLLKNIIILWDGRVALCCMDYDGQVILGDLKKHSLKEIYLRKISPLVKRHYALDFDMPLCRNCNVNQVI